VTPPPSPSLLLLLFPLLVLIQVNTQSIIYSHKAPLYTSSGGGMQFGKVALRIRCIQKILFPAFLHRTRSHCSPEVRHPSRGGQLRSCRSAAAGVPRSVHQGEPAGDPQSGGVIHPGGPFHNMNTRDSTKVPSI